MPRRKQQAPRRAAGTSRFPFLLWVGILSTWWVENVLPLVHKNT
uniref:Teashirt zinc finger homeobox 3 n=1 Tax=Saimiri boliviensis boliviensis TaxID=39432 RepID=A0A2K6TL75_SAIBB